MTQLQLQIKINYKDGILSISSFKEGTVSSTTVKLNDDEATVLFNYMKNIDLPFDKELT